MRKAYIARLEYAQNTLFEKKKTTLKVLFSALY